MRCLHGESLAIQENHKIIREGKKRNRGTIREEKFQKGPEKVNVCNSFGVRAMEV